MWSISVTDWNGPPPEPCYRWETGHRVRFEAESSGRDPAVRIADLLERLSDVVHPVQIGMASEDAVEGARFATLTSSALPPHVRAREYSQVDHRDVVPVLSPGSVRDWLGRELGAAQFRRLEVPVTRTRLLTPVGSGVFDLLARPGGQVAASFPVEDAADGRWISAPVVDAVIEPPVSVEVFDSYGTLAADVTVTWSWWFEPGAGEFDALRTTLHGLRADGWKPVRPVGGEAGDVYGLGEA
jgi:hypothetical protein